jgi:MFS family permease
LKAPFAGIFRSLRGFNYRVWVAGDFVSNIGTWVQRTAQDWLVFTQLTHHDASAVGVVMALQFGPQLLLLPWTGFAADHFNQRKLLIATQATMAGLALALGSLVVSGVVQLWHVYIFAFLFGCAAAFDAPVRQTFVAELVGDDDLHNAVALNATSFNVARMIGPAVCGVVIATIGTGWAFLINAASFIAVLMSLALLRVADLRPNARAQRARGNFTEGLRYVWGRPDLRAILVMLFLIGTFGLNFPIFISTMAVSVFHCDARGYGVLSSITAIGTVSGALIGAGRTRPKFGTLLVGATVFGLGCALAAIAPLLLAVRRRSRCYWRGRFDLCQHNEQPDAAFDRTRHARTGDGAACRHRAWGHAYRSADRRMGREHLRPALGAGGGCGIRLCRSGRGRHCLHANRT